MNLILGILTIVGSCAHAAEESRQILHLKLTCAGAPPVTRHDPVAYELRRLNREATIHEIKMVWPCHGTYPDQETAVETLHQALHAAVERVPHFDLLAFDFPENETKHAALVMPLGRLEAAGFDQALGEALAPLRGAGTSNAKIVLTAGHGLLGPDAEAQERARHLLDFVGAPRGSVFGLTQPQLYAEMPTRRDLRVGLIFFAIGMGFDAAMWTQPHFGAAQIALSMIYTIGLRMVHSTASTHLLKTDLSAEEAGNQTVRDLNATMASIIGTILAAAQVMTFADVGAGLITSTLGNAAVILPFLTLYHMGKRRWPWIKGTAKGTINGGRLFTANPDGGFNISVKNLEDDGRLIFSCEEALREPSTIKQLPFFDHAA